MSSSRLRNILTAAGAPFLLTFSAYAMLPLAQDGFRHFYNLDYDQAAADFRKEIAVHPDQPDGYNHLAQTILYRGLHRSGILENSVTSGDDLLLSLIRRPKLALNSMDEEEFQHALNVAVANAQAQTQKNPNDSAALYSLGVAYGLRANHNFLVRKAWLAAIRESNAARKLHNQVVELDPANVDALMMQGIHEYLVSSLPAPLRWLGAVTGLRGDKEAGLRMLEQVASQGSGGKVEARMLLATLYRHEKRPWTAISYLQLAFTKQHVEPVAGLEYFSPQGSAGLLPRAEGQRREFRGQGAHIRQPRSARIFLHPW